MTFSPELRSRSCRAFKTKVVNQLTGGLGHLRSSGRSLLHPGTALDFVTPLRLRSLGRTSGADALTFEARDHRHRITPVDGSRDEPRQPRLMDSRRARWRFQTSRSRCSLSAAVTSGSTPGPFMPRLGTKVTVVEDDERPAPGGGSRSREHSCAAYRVDVGGRPPQHQGRRDEESRTGLRSSSRAKVAGRCPKERTFRSRARVLSAAANSAFRVDQTKVRVNARGFIEWMARGARRSRHLRSATSSASRSR